MPTAQPPTPGRSLRDALAKGLVTAPGAFNALVARAIARAGFPACYISGAATSVSAGLPDIGLITLDRFAATIRDVAANAIAPSGHRIPVIADADTGFGEEEITRRAVLEYVHAGAAALHLEDQVFPKRCGHLDGKACVPTDHMLGKVEWAARAARASADPHFLICARTDAVAVEGFDAALARAAAYVEAGADMIFPEGLTSEADFARFAAAMARLPRPPYLLANMTEFGKTPIITADRFAALGYHVVIYPVTMLRVAMGAVTRALTHLRDHGSAEALLPAMQTRQELYELIAYTPAKPWELPA